MPRATLSRFPQLRLESLESREVPAAIAALDPSFATGSGGKLSVAGAPLNGVVLQPDGKIVVVGTAVTDFYIARFNPDGTNDSTFDGDGVKTVDIGGNDLAKGVALQSDGKIVIVGQTSSGNNLAVARLNADGSVDTSFDGDGIATVDFGGTDVANAVAIQPDGRILLAGSTDTVGNGAFAIARLNANGAPDNSFDGDGKRTIDFGVVADAAKAIAVQSNGKIVVIGDNFVDFEFARLNIDGSNDGAFNGGARTLDAGGPDAAIGLGIQSDGKIVVVGNNGPDIAVARLNAADGSTDATFGTAGLQIIDINGADGGEAVQFQPDGKILVIGDTNNDIAIVRLTSAGVLDTTFNATGIFTTDLGTASDLGTAAALTQQGRLVVAGQNAGFTTGTVIRVIVELDEARNTVVGGSVDARATLLAPDAGNRYNAAASLAPFGSLGVNVRTAVGDVNGDSVEDTIVVTGPGTPIRVAVVSGADNSTLLVSAFDPFGGNFTGGGFVAAQDFDNDGRSEFVVTPDRGGGPRVSIYSLSLDGSTTVRANFLGIDDGNFRGGARAAAGDINGDGVADIAVSAGFLGGPRTAIFNGTTLFGTPTRLVGDFFAFPGDDSTRLRNGVFVSVADVDGDGFSDLIFGGGPGGAPRVFILSGATVSSGNAAGAQAAPIANYFVAGNSGDRGGVRVSAADIDGDSLADVVVGSGEGSPARVRVYFGTTFGGGSEPTGFQDINVFGGGVLADGVFVG